MTLQNSFGVSLGHQLAIYETNYLKQEKVVPTLEFAGLTKIEDVLDENTLLSLGLNAENLPLINEEAQIFFGIFNKLNVSPRQIRRALRGKVGMGTYVHSNSVGYISRSDDTREAFEKGGKLAAEKGLDFLPISFLLAGLLAVGDELLINFLEEYQVDTDDMLELAVNADYTQLLKLYKDLESPGSVPKSRGHSQSGSRNILDDIGRDLVAEAREGLINEAIGRDEELLQIYAHMNSATSNIVLVGEAGVGKTAIVEGLAYRIAHNKKIPRFFRNKRIIEIKAASLVSGTNLRGEFEARMQEIIAAATSSPDIILFIDELHMLVGAGNSSSNGTLDAANILKVDLARGRLKVIGATTEREYRRYITTDDALERRFHLVPVHEPSPETTKQIIERVKPRIEDRYKVTIMDEAIDAAIELSEKYMPERKLPAKAFDLLNTACSRIHIDAEMEQLRNLDEDDYEQQDIEDECLIVEAVHVQKAMPKDVELTSNITREQVLDLENELNRRVIGQPDAARAVADAIGLNFVSLNTRKRPVGVFLFVGPTGVGKTEMARATAECLFGSPDHMIRIDMSEFMNKHSVARLIGAEPGYIGYEEGGQLTGALAAHPQSVVLLDEVEKAHPDVLNIFLQVFDAGRLTDGRGRTVDASRAIFMMTSNQGIIPGQKPNKQMIEQMIRGFFRPELLGRLDEIVHFNPLRPEDMRLIVRQHIEGITEILHGRQILLSITDNAVNYLADVGNDSMLGARPLLNLIRRKISKPISKMQLRGDLLPMQQVFIDFDGDDIVLSVDSTDTR